MRAYLRSLSSYARRLAARSRLRRWVRARDAQKAQEGPLATERGRYLYAAPIGKSGKQQLAKLLRALEHEPFDFMIFVYDGYKFEGPEFERCTFIHEPGIVYHFFKKYITPEVAARYDVIVIGVEDVEIDAFSWRRFLELMRQNRLDVASPALSRESITPHKIMYQQAAGPGRLVDVIEVFLTAFDARAWPRFWQLIESERNPWGWGYVQLAQALCGFKMGIVDSETISVLRGPTFRQEAQDEMNYVFDKHKDVRRARFVSYGTLESAASTQMDS